MTTLAKSHADDADAIVDRVLDAIDQEPADLRARLLAALKRREHVAARYPDRCVVFFPTVDQISYELTLVPRTKPRQFDA